MIVIEHEGLFKSTIFQRSPSGLTFFVFNSLKVVISMHGFFHFSEGSSIVGSTKLIFNDGTRGKKFGMLPIDFWDLEGIMFRFEQVSRFRTVFYSPDESPLNTVKRQLELISW